MSHNRSTLANPSIGSDVVAGLKIDHYIFTPLAAGLRLVFPLVAQSQLFFVVHSKSLALSSIRRKIFASAGFAHRLQEATS
ncbi:MAG TPA: hypothetical protein VJX70_07780 [Candidatus Acidoferrum sp.]|nr:hypothetical protein [Candidatus Acidoferrum sp.]